MSRLRIAFFVPVLAVVAAVADARADLQAWDQARVGALAQQLVEATDGLYDTFYKQPPPSRGSAQARAYQRLKQKVRRIRTEARALAGSLAKGEGYEETLPSYDDLMQTVRSARDDARQVFATSDVTDKAAAARGVLNQLGPYYDPDFRTLGPATR